MIRQSKIGYRNRWRRSLLAGREGRSPLLWPVLWRWVVRRRLMTFGEPLIRIIRHMTHDARPTVSKIYRAQHLVLFYEQESVEQSKYVGGWGWSYSIACVHLFYRHSLGCRQLNTNPAPMLWHLTFINQWSWKPKICVMVRFSCYSQKWGWNNMSYGF